MNGQTLLTDNSELLKMFQRMNFCNETSYVIKKFYLYTESTFLTQ